jgi:hypothetical protein
MQQLNFFFFVLNVKVADFHKNVCVFRMFEDESAIVWEKVS